MRTFEIFTMREKVFMLLLLPLLYFLLRAKVLLRGSLDIFFYIEYFLCTLNRVYKVYHSLNYVVDSITYIFTHINDQRDKLS